MRIKEFVIHRYGPLTETGIVRLNNFNLFWGENEEGKTLIIEALIKMLLGKTRKLIEDIDRVNEDPDGFIVIEQDDTEDAKIPEQGRISNLVNLSAEECANLFIIRNSELTISKESEFYGSVTERLTGLRSSQIQSVKNNLRNLGYLTDSLKTVNDRDSQYLAERLSKASQLIEKSQLLAGDARQKELDKLEEKVVLQTRELDSINQEIELQEKARIREKYEKGQKNILNLEGVQNKLKELKNYSDEKVTVWFQAEQVIKDEKDQIEQFKQRIHNYQQESEQNEKLIFKQETDLNILKKKQIRVEETLKPVFRKHRELSEKLIINAPVKKFLNFILSFISIALLVLLIGIIWKPSFAVYLSTGIVGLLLFGLSITYFFKLIRPVRGIEKCMQDIFSQAGEFGFIGDGIPELQKQIQQFDESIQRKEQEVNTVKNRNYILKNKIVELQQEHITRSEKRMLAAQQTIQEISVEFGVKTLEEFRKKLQERKKLDQVETESQSALGNLFGESGSSTKEKIKFWQSQIDKLSQFEEEASGINFDERELEKKKQKQSKLYQDIKAIQNQLETFQESLGQVEREAREILLLEKDPIPCQNLTDLTVVVSRLQEFIGKIEDKQNMVKKALKIFSEIETEEVQKVGSLFGEDKPVSNFFQDITESMYHAVIYDPLESMIQVQRNDGKLLSAKWLSGGAYDQLYFAIRLALGKELIPDQTGFFILDDPFIKSDTRRLKRMMDILVDVSKQGWQILYFSAKDEILDVLKKYVDTKDVTLHQVPKSKLLVSE